MSLTFGFYNSLNHDRLYTATQMSSVFDGIINDGVFMSIGDQLMVKQNEGMSVTVGIGRAWFNHTWTHNDSLYPLIIEQSNQVLSRIDAIVLKVDHSDAVRANTFEVIRGEQSSNPTRPIIENGETYFYHVLAYVSVPAGITQITQSEITNMIGTSVTPFITGILQTMNIDDLISQWWDQWNDQVTANQQAYEMWKNQQESLFETWSEEERTAYTEFTSTFERLFDSWYKDQKAGFDEWFKTIQYVLDGDAAGHLQVEIDNIRSLPDDEIDDIFEEE